MYTGDRKLYEHFDKAGAGFTGYRNTGSVYIDYAARNGGDPEPLFGHGPDFGYFQYGAIWYGDEIWNGGDFKDYDGDDRFSDWERSRWCAENGRTDCFLPWTTVQHPKLGKVEVGGINPKFWSQNPSADLIGEWAAKQASFNLYLSESLPQVKLSQVKVKTLRGGQSDGRPTRSRPPSRTRAASPPRWSRRRRSRSSPLTPSRSTVRGSSVKLPSSTWTAGRHRR